MKSERSTSPDRTLEHFFRHEYSRLVAVLWRKMGFKDLELVEDAAQSALLKAVEVWPASGEPDNPSAWLFRVAQNRLLDELRGVSRRRAILEKNAESLSGPQEMELPEPEEIRDDLLRMIFLCCDEEIPQRSQLVLALKTLCGFSVGEIALRLFAKEAGVYKRLQRARKALRPRELCPQDYAERLPSLLRIIYLLFTEGYLSAHAEHAIRLELCEEAIRLGSLLYESSVGKAPEVTALMALMYLHKARLSARVDGSGGLLLLEEQDRSNWDEADIFIGLRWLSVSARGDVPSRYHLEAAIAAEHCLAPSFEATNWEKVVEYYLLLEKASPSPVHTMNRAVALAEWKGPADGLAALESFEAPSWLTDSYLWAAVMADLCRRCHKPKRAAIYKQQALGKAPTEAVRVLLTRRLESPAQS